MIKNKRNVFAQLPPAAYQVEPAGRDAILPTSAVNEYCLFGSQRWPLNPPESLKATTAGEHSVVISWPPIYERLPHGVADDLKIFAYIYAARPYLIGRPRIPDAVTIVTRIRALVTTLCRLMEEKRFTSFREISLVAVVEYLRTAKNLNQVKAAFLLLCHPNVGKFLVGRFFPFNATQLRRALQDAPPIPSTKVDSPGDILGMPKLGYQVLPAPLFLFFTTENQKIIGIFLTLMGVVVCDDNFDIRQVEEELACWKNFKNAFKSYVRLRKLTRGEPDAKKRDALGTSLEREFYKTYGFRVGAFADFLDQAQMAGISQILLYTGMRYEEITLLQKGCLRSDAWGQSIYSTEVKRRKRSSKEVRPTVELFDKWVAIDILVDAVHVLETLCDIKGTKWLTATVNGNQSDRKQKVGPMGNNTLNGRLKKYLISIDKSGAFSNWRLHCHQFREGLVDQLARMEVRLSYISVQLKHLSYAAQAMSRGIPAKSTLGYGNLPRVLLATITGADAVERGRMEVASGLWGEGKNFAGAGADAHKKRVEAFFQGTALFGESRREYIQNLARNPLPIFVSGVGVCTLNLAVSKELLEIPPCLGDLHCNPRDCNNSVVPETHREAIERRLARNKLRASDPTFSHAKHFYLEQVAIYESMLNQLEGSQQ